MEPTRYEYFAVDIAGDNTGAANKYLNVLGADGWRLVAVDGGVAYLMREIAKA